MTQVRETAYDAIGGTEPVRRVVDRFYDLMEHDPAYAELRAMHKADLGPMRSSLTGFLVAWLGGPRDWFVERPGVCMMSAHRELAIDEKVAQQWACAMARAIEDSAIEPGFAQKMAGALGDLAKRMANR